MTKKKLETGIKTVVEVDGKKMNVVDALKFKFHKDVEKTIWETKYFSINFNTAHDD